MSASQHFSYQQSGVILRGEPRPLLRGDKSDHGHERLYDRLTGEEREVLRDFEAQAWGSHDVSEEDVESHLRAMTPQAWERIQPVMLARVEASRERQRAVEERQRVLEEWIAILRKLRDELS